MATPPRSEVEEGPPVGDSAPNPRDLDRSLLHGVAWTSAIKWFVQLITWAATILVMRLLTPEDYGLVGMAGLFLGLVALVSEFGLGSAVVAMRELSDRQIAQLNSVSILIGLGAFAVSAASAGLVADFFESPRLPPVILALSTTFVISALQVVPGAVLRRELQYRTLALVEGGGGIVDVGVTLLLAWLGYGYWSLVLGRIVKFAAAAGALCIIAPHRFGLPRFGDIRAALTFSSHVIVSRIGWYTYSNADYLIIGKYLGQGPLGLYNAAFTLSRMPAGKITGMVMRVTPGIFSAVQEDFAQLRRYILLLTEGLSLLTFPPLIGLGLVAADLIPLVLGDEWVGAVLPLQILAIGAALSAVTPILPQVIQVVRQTRYEMKVTLLAALVFLVGFAFAIRWGIPGVAVAWLVLHPTVIVGPLLLRVRRAVGLSLRAYGKALWPAVSGCLFMAGVVVSVQMLLGGRAAPKLLLATEVGSGALAYLAFILVAHRESVDRMMRAVKLLRT